ncbi:hypothetical protein MESS2_950005 [Mesorhizobium metallidurans STM 2683]|uniref:Uncharacterized protein n=1 Tax=Mesorhizobium metallidurans STM 2683 TaxID=1297569 RepID=M5EZ72_9HYPH|nr:hypothetical protein MESS2_950005 [Mesorhizobium metallidurans STM 2683]
MPDIYCDAMKGNVLMAEWHIHYGGRSVMICYYNACRQVSRGQPMIHAGLVSRIRAFALSMVAPRARS